ELGRVVGSRSFRLMQGLASSAPAQVARRVVWWMKDHLHRDVHVRATGRRNPASGGAEIWILELPGSGSGMRGNGHWRRSETPAGARAWMADGQGTLVMTPRDGDRLRLRAHPAGGIAEVRHLGRVHTVDLYRAEEAVLEVDAVRGEIPTESAPARSQAAAVPRPPGWGEALGPV